MHFIEALPVCVGSCGKGDQVTLLSPSHGWSNFCTLAWPLLDISSPPWAIGPSIICFLLTIPWLYCKVCHPYLAQQILMPLFSLFQSSLHSRRFLPLLIFFSSIFWFTIQQSSFQSCPILSHPYPSFPDHGYSHLSPASLAAFSSLFHHLVLSPTSQLLVSHLAQSRTHSQPPTHCPQCMPPFPHQLSTSWSLLHSVVPYIMIV